MSRLTTAIVLILLATPAAGQAPVPPKAEASPPAAIADLLGRDTPRGTITGFTQAVHREDFVTAQSYMQLTATQRPNAEALARTLADLLDRYFRHPISALSNSPAGVGADGLPVDRERLTLDMPRRPEEIVLRRVADPKAAQIWLISSETLARVPSLGRSLEESWVERHLPEAMVRQSVFGLSLASLTLWAGSILAPFLLLWMISQLLRVLARLASRDEVRRARFDAWFRQLRLATVGVLTLAVHLVLLPSLTFTLVFRLVYARWVAAVMVILLAVLGWRFMGLLFTRARTLARRRGNAGTESLMMLGERMVKGVIILLSIFLLLSVAGVNTATALTGVGIGGVALALGAQKSVENLVGGIVLLTDRALAVGDFCRVADHLGWIEDITLRSVRLRTLDQTLLSIPAGILSQANIENFATRNKILIQTILRIRYGTSARQLRAIVDHIHAVIVAHPLLDATDARIRVVNFGVQAIELELFTYVKTADYQQFLAVRESVLLDVVSIVESEGSGFARPTEFVYLNDEATAHAPVNVSSRT